MKPILFLTSILDVYDRDKSGNKIPKNFGNYNHILDNLRKYIKKYDHFLFVASDETNTTATDDYANAVFQSFSLTLPFKSYHVLDIRSENKAKELIKQADFIYLCGGHLPSQNQFFNKIHLKELMQDTTAVICGVSAGSMNSAEDVYSAPELEGESIDPAFKRSLPGLGLTNLNILPHYKAFRNHVLDGRKYVKDIILPDSYSRTIYALYDGSYFLVTPEKTYLYGKSYLIQNGKIKRLNLFRRIKMF